MGLTITSYPTATTGGSVLNLNPSLKPIEVVFERTVTAVDEADINVIGIELIIVDLDVPAKPLLDFSLYADFGLNVSPLADLGLELNYAVIDTSIIGDTLSQEVLTDTMNVTGSRVKYRIKWRKIYNDGTIGSYNEETLRTPIIAVYSTQEIVNDNWAEDREIVKQWSGYPCMSGFFRSDSNHAGLDIKVTYDQFDITKAAIASDNLLFNFGSNTYGLNVVDLAVGSSNVETGMPNAGWIDTTEWIDSDLDGIADLWSALNGSIVTGNGFSGRAQRSENSTSGGLNDVLVSWIKAYIIPVPLVYVKFRFKYRSNVDLVAFADNGWIFPDIIPANTGDAVYYETDTILLGGGEIDFTIRLTLDGVPSINDWLEVSEIRYVIVGQLNDNTKYIDYKIISE